MRLKAAAVHQEDRAPLMGHRVGHVNNEHYLDQQITLQEAARLIGLLKFEHIDFSELKRPPDDYHRMLLASKGRLTKVARYELATVKQKARSVGHDSKAPARSQSARPKRNKGTA